MPKVEPKRAAGLKLSEILEITGGELEGDASAVIHNIAQIENAKEGDITFISDNKYIHYLSQTKASAVIVSEEVTAADKNIIKVKNPYLSFIKVVNAFYPIDTGLKEGIDEKAVVGENCNIGEGAAIGAYAVLAEKVTIGKGVKVFPGVYLGKNVEIDENTIVYPNVTILRDVFIGKRVIIHAGTVIGADGFGFVRDGKKYIKIPHIGKIVIEDDVEIGANCTIDRATFGETRVKSGCKLDNLVHLAHNVTVGEHSVMAAQVGISGSTSIGKEVQIGGQAGFIHHIKIGDRVQVAAKSGVINSLLDDSYVFGIPAKPHSEAKRIEICLRKLPELFKRVKDLENKK